jgi:ABC-type proline/glycine betaine transport system ATPase subunit
MAGVVHGNGAGEAVSYPAAVCHTSPLEELMVRRIGYVFQVFGILPYAVISHCLLSGVMGSKISTSTRHLRLLPGHHLSFLCPLEHLV